MGEPRAREGGRPILAGAAIASLVAIVLAAAGTASADVVLPGPGEDEPVLVDETFEGGAAVSLTVELSGPALYRIDLVGEGPRTGTVTSMGFVAFDDERAYNGSVVVTGFTSQQRQRTVVAGDELPAPAYALPDASGEPFSTVFADGEGRERPCPLACASRLELPERTEAGTFHHGLWLGGVDETRLQVLGDANVTSVAVHASGTPLVAGSEDFQAGTANVQHQPTTNLGEERAFVGAKAVHGASYEATVDGGLYGVLGLADFKKACAGVCLGSETARSACGLAAPADCRVAQMTWEGPAGSGQASHHVFGGGEPGAYEFGVEQMVDGYGSSTPVVADYAWADPGEHHPYLSAADLPLPPADA